MAHRIPWQIPPGFPDVEVSPHGDIRAKGNQKTPFKMNNGYLAVSVNRRPVTVHRLVCLAFHGLPSANTPMALHRNGNNLDNSPDNLYWGNAKDNAADAKDHGTLATGKRHGAHTHPERFTASHLLGAGGGNTSQRKLSEAAVQEIRATYIPRHPLRNGKALADKFNVDPATIRKVCVGTTYQGVA